MSVSPRAYLHIINVTFEVLLCRFFFSKGRQCKAKRYMSTQQTDEWLVAAQEALAYNIEEGDYRSCLEVIADVRSKGFPEASQAMRSELRAVPLEKFVTKTPYDY